MDVVYITTLVFLLTVVQSHDVKESLACYGSKGNRCTTHSLECENHKIAILDAFYSNNSNCSTTGASACSNDIFQNYTVRLGELNMTDTDALYRNCSLQESCDYQAPRNNTINFSVVHYMCIKESKACSGAKGNQCTKHSLDCNEDQIAILDSFYSENSHCLITGGSNCSTDNLEKHSARQGELKKTEADVLYRNCSLEGRCEWLASRNGTMNFSVVEYICIKATTDICSMETINGDNITLLWNNTNTPHTCSCTISTNHPRGTVLLLDMLPKYRCSQLNVTIVGNTRSRNCSTNNLYAWSVTSTNPIVLHPVNALLGIQILGAVNGSCISNMSTEGQASITILPAPRTNDAHEGQRNVSVNWSTEGQSSITTTTLPRQSANEDGNEGAIAGSVTAVIIILIIVAGVIIWLKFVRKKKEDKKTENGNDNYALAGSHPIIDVQDRGSRRTTSNYDYTTITEGTNPVGRAQNEYVLAGKPSTENGTVLQEDDYNHINHNPPQSASSPGYDTTASAAAAVKKLKNASSNSIDDDDYNHLGDGKPSVVSSDYDTTVSASKTLAQLGEIKDSEDDYDHFKRSEDSVIDSPYDTANHHSVVSADTTPSMKLQLRN